MTLTNLEFQDSAACVAALDAADPLAGLREQFLIPPHGEEAAVYLCGNSLGLQPAAVRQAVNDELDDWAQLAVEGHFDGRLPWMRYHEYLRDGLASVCGALPDEVVAMNSLGTNLHLLMVSFYRPTSERNAIMIEAGAFPTDRYAVVSQMRFHGHHPGESLIELQPDEDNGCLSMAAIEQALDEHGDRTALLLLPGVQYRTGQAFDIEAITKLAHAHGCMVGFDMAHAIGNLPLALHDSDADFAVWCSYKYLNAGPGAVGGAFVHQRHAQAKLPRFAGWWGHDKADRFKMPDRFNPTPGADGWQLSNPPILAMAPLRVSLEMFHQTGMSALRQKSTRLTAWLEWLVRQRLSPLLEVLTPAAHEQRGAQLSMRVKAGREDGQALFDHLINAGVIVDWREPDVIRAAPVPMYNSYADCRRFVDEVEAWNA